jgi:uncharacterized membrane protein YoaK (UPF0700 family)
MIVDRKPFLSHTLGFLGGYVDTAGFLALQGLFTAHVTGNFVTLGAASSLGLSGYISKLMALPVFCLGVMATRYISAWRVERHVPVLRFLFVIQFALLFIGGALAIALGPFPEGDAWQAIVTGQTLVLAMSVQNATHRIHLSAMPPSTLMTGTTTQVMIDLADVLRLPRGESAVAATRLRSLAPGILSFALGCLSAAVLFQGVGTWCFALPPFLVLLAARVAPSEEELRAPAKPA